MRPVEGSSFACRPTATSTASSPCTRVGDRSCSRSPALRRIDVEGAVCFRRKGRHELLHPLRAPPQLRRRHLHDEGCDTRPDVEAAGQAIAGERRARVARSARSARQGLVDEDAGGDDIQAQPRPASGSMHRVLAFLSRHVQLRGGRSGAAARVRRIRDVHAWPEARRPLQHLRAIPRYPIGDAALPPPGRPRGA